MFLCCRTISAVSWDVMFASVSLRVDVLCAYPEIAWGACSGPLLLRTKAGIPRARSVVETRM